MTHITDSWEEVPVGEKRSSKLYLKPHLQCLHLPLPRYVLIKGNEMDSFCILALLEVSQSIKNILSFQNRWKCKYGLFLSLRPFLLQRLKECSNRICIHQPLELRGWCMHRSSYTISHSQNILTSSKIQRGWEGERELHDTWLLEEKSSAQ